MLDLNFRFSSSADKRNLFRVDIGVFNFAIKMTNRSTEFTKEAVGRLLASVKLKSYHH